MTEQAADALDDRKTEAKTRAAVLRLGAFAAIKLFEDAIELALLDSGTGIPDLKADEPIAWACRQQYSTLLRISNCIGQQVSNHALQQQRIAFDRNATASDTQRKPFRCRQRCELLLEQRKHVVDQNLLDARLNRSRIESRDFEKLFDQL